MSNMETWDKISKPPITALKAISAGRLKGKSDINPMWRMQAMTELYGPCGTGWKYTIDKLWSEAGDGVQIASFALVSLFYKVGEHWSDPIPGIGGSMLIEQESKGPHTSDEAYKMAVTDALSVAMKALGMAAEIYLGNFDGSKYAVKKEAQNQTATTETPPVNKNLLTELMAYCGGDVEKADTVLKRISHYESDGKEYSFGLDRLPKTSEKWAGKALTALKKLVAAESEAKDTEADLPV